MKGKKQWRKTLVYLVCAAMLCAGLLASGNMSRVSAADDACAHHTHDEACGYEETTGTCAYECQVCKVQEMLDALPEASEITEENAESVKAQLTAIDEAKKDLSDEELDSLNAEKYNAVSEALGSMTEAKTLDDSDDSNASTDADKPIKVEYDGQTYYFDAFGGTQESVTDTASLENGLNYWLIKNTTSDKPITITLQKNVEGITYGFIIPGSGIGTFNPWALEGNANSNLAICVDRTVVLNLNGHKISGDIAYEFWNSGIISNLGNLTINGSGVIENTNAAGYNIYLGSDRYNVYSALSLNNVTIQGAENSTGRGVVLSQGKGNVFENCKFVNVATGIDIGTVSSVEAIKNCEFKEGIGRAVLISNADTKSPNPMIGSIEGCTIIGSVQGAICGSSNAYAYANIGTIKDTTITTTSSAIWSVRYVGCIDNCKMEVTGHETAQSATAAKIIQTTLGVGKITGDTYLKGTLAIPIHTSGGTTTIESGTFETDFDTAVYVDRYYSGELNILGGTFIKGDKVLDAEKDVPVVVNGSQEINYPFGKTLDEWQGNPENTFTLDYDADKLKEDTAEALAAIEAEQDEAAKEELAKALQENINAITDKTMRAAVQKQADDSLQAVNGTVTIVFPNGEAEEMIVAKGSIPALAEPVKDGYIFKGWYMDEAYSIPYEASAVSDDLALYAKWEKKAEVTPEKPGQLGGGNGTSGSGNTQTGNKTAGKDASTAAKTGDTSPVILWSMLLALTGAAVVITVMRKRKMR